MWDEMDSSDDDDSEQPMRNGYITDTPQYSKSQDITEENFAQKKDRYRRDHAENAKTGRERGLQESWENYHSALDYYFTHIWNLPIM